jgi:hypothetical protein
MSTWLLALICGLVIGYWLGYAFAHSDVARECERLGGFYVGKTVYKCTKVEK